MSINSANAKTIEMELEWFQQLILLRGKISFEQSVPEEEIWNLSLPNVEDQHSPYAKLIKEHSMNMAERLVLILALIPHVKPSMLDLLHMKNTLYDIPFTEFGGIRYNKHKGYLPTKPHPYKTNRGNPKYKSDRMIVYNQLIYGQEIRRPDWGLYFKMFESLFASVAVAFLVFFMNPQGDGRVGLGIGAFFAAVASSYVTTTELPGIGILTLSDLINILGMTTVFLSVLCSIIVMKVAEDNSKLGLAKIFDRLSFVIFMAGYSIANIVIALMA